MITDDAADKLFSALSHRTRRQMLDILRAKPGLPVGELAANFDVSRIAVMNHLSVLEGAGLVLSKKEGRQRLLYLNAMPIREIYDRWTDTYADHWLGRMNYIKQAAEAAAKKDTP